VDPGLEGALHQRGPGRVAHRARPGQAHLTAQQRGVRRGEPGKDHVAKRRRQFFDHTSHASRDFGRHHIFLDG
jgi:hypothetical protein